MKPLTTPPGTKKMTEKMKMLMIFHLLLTMIGNLPLSRNVLEKRFLCFPQRIRKKVQKLGKGNIKWINQVQTKM